MREDGAVCGVERVVDCNNRPDVFETSVILEFVLRTGTLVFVDDNAVAINVTVVE